MVLDLTYWRQKNSLFLHYLASLPSYLPGREVVTRCGEGDGNLKYLRRFDYSARIDQSLSMLAIRFGYLFQSAEPARTSNSSDLGRGPHGQFGIEECIRAITASALRVSKRSCQPRNPPSGLSGLWLRGVSR
jgi:hypothetical protein